MGFLNDFFEFIRLRISLFGAFIPLSGFLIFNELSYKLFFVFLGGFFISAVTYSFNQFTDKEEDLINKKKLNEFVVNEKEGKFLVLALFSFAIIFSYILSFFSFLIALIILSLNVVYSYFRFKRIFVLKNLFTSFMSFPLFFYGTLLHSLPLPLIEYSLALFVFVLMVSMSGDLRDYKGDKRAGLKTFATVFDLSAAHKLLYLLFFIFSSIVLFSNLVFFTILIPFVFFSILLVYLNRVKLSLKYLLMGMIFTPFFILLLEV